MKLPDFLPRGKGTPGAPEDFPAGTVERARALTIGMLSAWELATTTEKEWRYRSDRAEREKVHATFGFKDFDAFLKACIGETAETATEKVKNRADNPKLRNANGRPKTRSKTTGLGRGADYLTVRISEDHPDILKRMKAGEFKSVRQAAIAAGIVKVKAPLEQALFWFDKLSPADKKKFHARVRS